MKNNQLTGKYLEAYKESERYVKLYLNYKESLNGNDCLIEIQDLLSIAEKEGKDIEEVVGTDLNKFVRTVYKAYYPFSLVKYVYLIHMVAITISIAIVFLFSVFNIEDDAHTYLNIYLISVGTTLIGDIIKRSIVSISNKFKGLYNLITKRLVSSILNNIGFFLFIILMGNSFVDNFVSAMTFRLVFLFSAVPGVVYIFKTEYSQVSSKKSVSFKDSIFKNLDKQFDKRNNKLKLKNQDIMTQDDWIKRLEKRYKYTDIFTAIVTVAYLVLIFYMINSQVEEGFTAQGIALSIFLVFIVLFLMSYYLNKKHVNEYINNKRLEDVEQL